MAPMFRVFPNTPEDYIGGGCCQDLRTIYMRSRVIIGSPQKNLASVPPTRPHVVEALNPKVLTQIAQGQEGFKKGFCLGYSSGASEGRAP